MPSLVDEDQTCGAQGRNIQDNLTVLRDVIGYVTLYKNQAAVVLIRKKPLTISNGTTALHDGKDGHPEW